MRAIDADRLQKQFDLKSTNPNYRVNMHNIKSIITNAPTVEAIPKADYENRLKADMVAILDKIRAEIMELYNDRPRSYNHDQRTEAFGEIIKIIDKYKAESEVEDGVHED